MAQLLAAPVLEPPDGVEEGVDVPLEELSLELVEVEVEVDALDVDAALSPAGFLAPPGLL
jgi:hypothetical protein